MANVRKNWTKTDWNTAFDEAINTGLTAVGVVLEDRSVALCPTRTGRLKASITYATYHERDRVRPPEPAPGYVAVNPTNEDEVSKPTDKHTLYVGTNVEYAPYVEYGYAISGKGFFWRKAGQSYLRRALDESRKEIPELFNKFFHKAVLKHGK